MQPRAEGRARGETPPFRADIQNPNSQEERTMAVETGTAMKEFAGIFYREGALEPKTMQLVALAAMAAAGCTS